jgi:hypothetical protein
VNENERQKRRHKRLQKQKEKRDSRSRPGRGPNDVAKDPAQGKGWPVGDCWVSQTWDEPGTKVDAVFSRVQANGAAVVATFTLDRSGPGLLRAEVFGGLRAEHVTSHAGRLGEESGTALIETTAAVVVALVRDAVARGANGTPPDAAAALDLLAGVEPATLDVPFGPPPPKHERGGVVGWLSRWFGG